MHFIQAHPDAESVSHIPQTFRARRGNFRFNLRTVCGDLVKAGHAGFEATQRFLQRFLLGAADGHHFTHRLHLRSQAIIGLREFLERKARDLGDHVVNRRFERSRSLATGDFVLQFVQCVAHSQLGGDLGDREASGLGGQRRGARHTRVHLNHDQTAVFRVHRELHVRTARIHTDLAQYRDRCVTHDLVFLVGEGLGRGHGDRVTGMHAHRVQVLNGTDDDAVVGAVTHDFHLVLFPAQQRLFNQQLVGRRQIQTTGTDFNKFLDVVGDTAARATHGKRWANNRREAQVGLRSERFFQRMGNGRLG